MADPIAPVAGVSPRAAALQKLKAQMPAASQKVAQQFQAGQAMQLQNAVKAAPTSAPVAATAQQAGAVQTAAVGQQAVQQAGQLQQQQQQVGGMALDAQKQATQKTLTGIEEGNKAEEMSGRDKLNNISEDAAKELFDKQMVFAKDENGRTFMNERQIADYMKTKATSDEQLKNYAQKAQQIQKTSMRIQQAAYDKLTSALEDESKLSNMGYDKDMILQLRELKQQMESDLQQKQANAEKSGFFWGAVGTVFGAAAGGSSGAAAGGGLGQAFGSANS